MDCFERAEVHAPQTARRPARWIQSTGMRTCISAERPPRTSFRHLWIAAGTAAYLLACRLLGVREIDTLLSLRARFRRP